MPNAVTDNHPPQGTGVQSNISNPALINIGDSTSARQQKKKRQDTMIPKTFRFDLGSSEIRFDAPGISIDEETVAMFAQQRSYASCCTGMLCKSDGKSQGCKRNEDGVLKGPNLMCNCNSIGAGCKVTNKIETKCADNSKNSSTSVAPVGVGPTALCSQSFASSEAVSETFADLVDRWISEESSLDTLPSNVATSVQFDLDL